MTINKFQTESKPNTTLKYKILLSTLLTICILIAGGFSSLQTNTITEETPWGREIFVIPQFKNKNYSILEYGANSSNGFNNQFSIQSAIDNCHKNGGGMVIIPEGIWNTSYLELKSNVNLHIAKNAVLSFLDSIDLYKVPTFTRWEGIECLNYHPFIYARNANNIAISGSGKIVGNGKKWWDMARGTQLKSLTKLYDLVGNNVAPEDRNCLDFAPTSYLRPSLIQTTNCTNVLVEDIEVGSGPMWTIHFVYSENVIARNIKVITVGTNNDGIIPDASKKVLIENCYFSTGDDCIVIKSGLNEDGWRVAKASERIIIKNCKTKHGHGGVVIGSEMSGGVRNVYAYNCNFSNTERGIRIKSMKGRGGAVENIWFDNITMDSIQREAIRLNMHYGSSSIEPRTKELPVFKNFHFTNISSSNSQYAIRISGIEEQKIDSIYFKNIKMKGEFGVVVDNASNCEFDSLIIESLKGEPVQISNGTGIVFNNSNFKSDSKILLNLKGINSGLLFKNVNNDSYSTNYVSEHKKSTEVVFEK